MRDCIELDILYHKISYFKFRLSFALFILVGGICVNFLHIRNETGSARVCARQPRDIFSPVLTNAFSGRYFLSASIDYGRYSNAKISLVESLAIALILNRTAVIPHLECCRETSKSAFGLFDFSALPVPVISIDAFDFESNCDAKGNNWIYVDSGASSFMSEEPSFFRGRMPERLQDSGGSLLRMLERTEVRKVTCIVLSKHFKVLQNLASSSEITTSSDRAQTSISSLLLPHNSIADGARRFLKNIRLDAQPFIGIHLRQTDFLTWGEHKSFAKACNDNPDLLLRHIHNVAKLGIYFDKKTQPSIVLATDDYFSTCSESVSRAFDKAIVLLSASVFKEGSCEEASFDQEVLGASTTFIGDGMSTFSDAIRLIRTNRNHFSPETNLLLIA